MHELTKSKALFGEAFNILKNDQLYKKRLRRNMKSAKLKLTSRYNEHAFIDEHEEKELARLYQLYQNVTGSPLPFVVLGDDNLRENAQIMSNFKPLTNQTSGDTGAILNTEQWWPLMNHSFALGFVHASKRVHIALTPDEITEKILDSKGNITPLGFELAICKLAGYQCLKLFPPDDKRNHNIEIKCGMTLLPPSRPQSVTMNKYLTEISRLKRLAPPEDARKYIMELFANDNTITPQAEDDDNADPGVTEAKRLVEELNSLLQLKEKITKDVWRDYLQLSYDKASNCPPSMPTRATSSPARYPTESTSLGGSPFTRAPKRTLEELTNLSCPETPSIKLAATPATQLTLKLDIFSLSPDRAAMAGPSPVKEEDQAKRPRGYPGIS